LLFEIVAHNRVEKRIQHAVQIGQCVRERLENKKTWTCEWKIFVQLHGQMETMNWQPVEAK
jgi:hypothetical protein